MKAQTMQLKQVLRNTKKMEEEYETAVNKVIDALHMYTHIKEQQIAQTLLAYMVTTNNDEEATVAIFNEFRRFAEKIEAYEVMIIIAEQERELKIDGFTTAG